MPKKAKSPLVNSPPTRSVETKAAHPPHERKWSETWWAKSILATAVAVVAGLIVWQVTEHFGKSAVPSGSSAAETGARPRDPQSQTKPDGRGQEMQPGRSQAPGRAPRERPVDRNVIRPSDVTPEPNLASTPKGQGSHEVRVLPPPTYMAKVYPPPDLGVTAHSGAAHAAPASRGTSSPLSAKPAAQPQPAAAGQAPWVQSQDQKAEIQKRLSSQFALTQPTKDKSDIAAAGAVLVLHKNNLLMYGTSNPIAPQSTYKKGKITRNAFGKNLLRDFGNTMVVPGSSVDIVQRTFVTGEKFWVTKVDVKDDGVVFDLFSDPFDGVRYFGELKFPFPKGQAPPADELMNNIAEVLTVEPADDSSDGDPRSQASTPDPPALDMPPPPPKTIALGQTKDQVVATFGQPQKVVTVGTKEIDYYPDMKVTFVNGKVTDVE